MTLSAKSLGVLLVFCLAFGSAVASADGPLALSVVKVKSKGGMTEVTIAVENTTKKDLEFQCCTTYLETTSGYAVTSLDHDQVRSQIYNRAKTGALLGGIAALGLGLGGAFSGHDELGYAALGVGAGSVAAGVVGGAVKEGAERGLIIDDIMRNQMFPAGLKVAGVAYFPPKKKWPGSKEAQAVHLSYSYKGKTYRTSAFVRQ